MPTSGDELRAVFEVVEEGKDQAEARRRLPRRDRVTVIKAYNVVRVFQLWGLETINNDTAGEIADEAKYSATSAYVQKLFLFWQAWRNEKRQLIPNGIGGTSGNNVLRPIPEEWPHGFLTGTKETLRGPAAMRWSTARPQQVGDEFTLDLGQEVPLKAIQFLQGTGHQWDCPKRWKMTFSNNRQIIEEVEGEGFVEVERNNPTPIQWIGVVIVEPRLPTDHLPATCWAIDNIELE